MAKPPCCSIWLANGQQVRFEHRVNIRYYEILRDAIDQKQTGWMELESAFEGGKIMLRLEAIQEIGLFPTSYWQAHEQANESPDWCR